MVAPEKTLQRNFVINVLLMNDFQFSFGINKYSKWQIALLTFKSF